MQTPKEPWSNPQWPLSKAQPTINGPKKRRPAKKTDAIKPDSAAPRVLPK